MSSTRCITLLFFVFLLGSCGTEKKSSNTVEPTLDTTNQDPEKAVSDVFEEILDSAEVDGCIILFDVSNNRYISNNFEEANRRVLPASTYKIPHSIIGLETGILTDENTVFKWDGSERSFAIWEKDLTLRDAFQLSCVPCYQEMAAKIGVTRMNSHLEQLRFGNMDVNKETLTSFWLVGNSQISALEQVDFLQRFYSKELPISDSTYQTMINVFMMEEKPDYSISGKTGLGIRDDGNIGWFVGYINKGNNLYYFATRVTPKVVDMPLNNFRPKRKEVTYAALKALEILP